MKRLILATVLAALLPLQAMAASIAVSVEFGPGLTDRAIIWDLFNEISEPNFLQLVVDESAILSLAGLPSVQSVGDPTITITALPPDIVKTSIRLPFTVPEPTSAVLLGVGLSALAIIKRRKGTV